MLHALKDAKRQGRPQANTEGSTASQLTGAMVLKDNSLHRISPEGLREFMWVFHTCSIISSLIQRVVVEISSFCNALSPTPRIENLTLISREAGTFRRDE